MRSFLSKRFKKLRNSNAEDIMETANLREIFLNFIDIQSNNETNCKQIECYNLCNGIITNTVDVSDLSIMIRIMDAATNETWKNTLSFFHKSQEHKKNERKVER